MRHRCVILLLFVTVLNNIRINNTILKSENKKLKIRVHRGYEPYGDGIGIVSRNLKNENTVKASPFF